MKFTKSELKNLIKEEVVRKKNIEDLEARKVKLTEELSAIMQECGMGGEMEEHGDGIGLGIKHLAGEEERLAEEKPSACLDEKKRSNGVKTTKVGKNTGKKGK